MKKSKLVKQALKNPNLYSPEKGFSAGHTWKSLLNPINATITLKLKIITMETQTEHDQETIFTKEPIMIVGERLNGRLAMLGIIAALGAYAVTGKIIPGLW